MKKIAFILLAALLVCGMSSLSFAANRSMGDDGGWVAPKAYDWSPERTFRWVRYVAPSTSAALISTESKLTADSIVIWDCTSDDGVTVTTTTTSYDSAVAGVVLNDILTPDLNTDGNSAQNSYSKRNWGWLQTYGLAEVSGMTLGTAAVKSAVGTSSQCGKAGTFVASTTNPVLQGNAGVYLDAYTAGATDVEVFLKCE